MKAFYSEQFRYNQWANERLIGFITENQLQNNRLNPIFSHLTVAQVLWVDRLHKKNVPININEWANWSWTEISKKCKDSDKALVQFVDKHPDNLYDETLEYVNSSGTPHKRTVRQVLINLLHYTSYHRGQLAAIIHQNENMATPSTEFLDYLAA